MPITAPRRGGSPSGSPLLPGPSFHPGADGPRGSYALWAPLIDRLALAVDGGAPQPLTRDGDGWHHGQVSGLRDGSRYVLHAEGRDPLPDPVSRFQPDGVHGASQAIDLADFPWTDGTWRGRPLADLVFYELHVGTFTAAGTCDAAIARLDELADLGITAIELMPVAQCPGARNWGYDGVFPFAVQHSIGGPRALQRLVDACHARGLAVILDVVYNHFGPEGNRLGDVMPIANDAYRTPWGAAVNVDGPDCDGVRDLLLANAWSWFAAFHVDGLRLDAVHAICDLSADPFIAELARSTARWGGELGRPLHLIAESDLNASRMVRRAEQGGYGLDAQWNDDFHHALHTVLTGEKRGFLADFGTVEQLRRAYARAYVFDGRWSAERRRTFGDEAADLPTERFVVCIQNHDQVGNRLHGERLPALTDGPGLRCAAAAVLLSPYLPLLFMGEEYGERRPFLYFVDHGDPALVEAVRAGRRREFAALHGSGEAPDPAAVGTRDESCIDPPPDDEDSRRLWRFYRTCLILRRTLPSLRPGPRRAMEVAGPHPAVVQVRREAGACTTLLLLNATADAATVPLPAGAWRTALDSADPRWGGPRTAALMPTDTIDLPPRTAVLLRTLP